MQFSLFLRKANYYRCSELPEMSSVIIPSRQNCCYNQCCCIILE